MTCPQCHAQLSDAAAFCFRCGASISQSTTFSYLPADAPPWPTATASLAYLTSATTGQAQRTNKKKAAVKVLRAVGRFFAMTGLCLLALALGVVLALGVLWANGGFSKTQLKTIAHVPAAPLTMPTSISSTPASTLQNQLPTPISFQTFTIDELGVQASYPTGWTKDTLQVAPDSSSLSVHPQQNTDIFIAIKRYSASASARFTSTSEVNQANLTAIANTENLHDMQTIQASTTQLTIGGALWDEEDATFANSSGVLLHCATIAVQHNNLYYAILFFAPGISYNAALQEYFQPMLNSFQFLN